jgi:hypothetical protein
MSITEADLDRRLNVNGWGWMLISTLTPGVVRIQLANAGEEDWGWRACVEAPTLEEAVAQAEALVNSTSASEYMAQMGGQP